jgi:hypothetical protein
MDFVLFIYQDASESGAVLKCIIEEKFSGFSLQEIQTFSRFKIRLKELPNYIYKKQNVNQSKMNTYERR